MIMMTCENVTAKMIATACRHLPPPNTASTFNCGKVLHRDALLGSKLHAQQLVLNDNEFASRLFDTTADPMAESPSSSLELHSRYS